MPARSGGSARAEIAGAGIQITAPPSPIANSATPSAGPLGATAASPSAAVEIESPSRTSQTSVSLDAAHDTASVPSR